MQNKKCMIIGFNDFSFEEYCQMLDQLAPDAAAKRDLRLAFVDYDGERCHALGVLNKTRRMQGLSDLNLNNADFLWPVVMVLGSYLEKHAIAFDYVNLFQHEKDVLAQKLSTGDFSTVVITTTLYVMPHPVQEIVDFVRACAPQVRIIIGGPYISGLFKAHERDMLGDYLSVLGGDIYINSNEGEDTLRQVLEAVNAGRPVAGLSRTAVMEGDGWVFGADEPEYNELKENFVNYRLFQPRGIGRFLSTRTAKSCPYSCAFCGFPQRAGKYRYLSTADVERELDAIKAIGTVDTVTFLDDTFNVPKQRFREIMQMMIDNRYGFKWNSFYRSDQGDEQTIELMARAGCEGVFLGIESASDKMLALMRKTSRRKNYEQAITAFRAAGIATHASFIIGFPGETLETVQESLDFIETFRPDTFRAQVWYCDPLTPIWNDREKYGITGAGFDWAHATMDSEQAASITERFFLTAEHSTWLPQFGFEQWSLFYLHRMGMEKRNILGYLDGFNAAVKHQLLHGDDVPLPDPVTERFRFSAALPAQAPRVGAVSLSRAAAVRFKQAEARLRETARRVDSDPAHALGVQTGKQTQTSVMGVAQRDRGADPDVGVAVQFLRQASKTLGSDRFLVQWIDGEGERLIAVDALAGCSDEALCADVSASLARASRLDSHERYLLSRHSRLRAAGIVAHQPVLKVFAGVPHAEACLDSAPYMHLVLSRSGHEGRVASALTNFVRWTDARQDADRAGEAEEPLVILKAQ
ncbi:PhpK family radical SAM P-methyltransferase [Pseudomonas sp. MSSRFD41]|uniref:PhpK family radical SAM P-methyltransferase n=1 Tax=Pseudomonas sp. MSSRFD41 TaxID=1310370 RepID=UPI00163B4017|nr:PhpK family radical SAM P-methyltransferase [Pseudomonas sp. MSSRFD41]MBC2656615.1 PhpK family radical SAM P-methyltransferase [Pseudomonas sp. MSSRFD41]